MNLSNDTQAEIMSNQQHFLNLEGLLTITEVVPTATPRKLSEGLVLVRSGGSTRAYFFDSAWRYAALT
jgi:hypothetical protein